MSVLGRPAGVTEVGAADRIGGMLLEGEVTDNKTDVGGGGGLVKIGAAGELGLLFTNGLRATTGWSSPFYKNMKLSY